MASWNDIFSYFSFHNVVSGHLLECSLSVPFMSLHLMVGKWKKNPSRITLLLNGRLNVHPYFCHLNQIPSVCLVTNTNEDIWNRVKMLTFDSRRFWLEWSDSKLNRNGRIIDEWDVLDPTKVISKCWKQTCVSRKWINPLSFDWDLS